MAERFFLWLLPPAPTSERFASLIGELSRRLGTPRFEPHITLIGPVDSSLDEIVTRLTALAESLPPVPVRLTGAGGTEEYFRCLFMRAARDPLLLAAHAAASGRFGRPPEAGFMPHLSLVYGKLRPRQKQKIIEEIGARFDMAFEVKQIGVCLPDGPADQWRLLRTFALTGRPAAQAEKKQAGC